MKFLLAEFCPLKTEIQTEVDGIGSPFLLPPDPASIALREGYDRSRRY